MANFVAGKHDIGLLRSDGSTTTGFMLAKKNGVPRYRRYDDDPLAEQRATGEPGYGWFPPGKEFPIILDDFSGGLSQEVYDPANPSKYFTSYNMDLRFGNAIAGMKPTTLTKPANKVVRRSADYNDGLWAGIGTELCELDADGDEFVSQKSFSMNIITLHRFLDYLMIGFGADYPYWYSVEAKIGTDFLNKGFENWTNATTLANWTTTSGSLAREAATTKSGTYSARLKDNGADDGIIYQDISWTDDYQSREFVLKVWVYPVANPANIVIAINDGTDANTASPSGTGAWEQVTVTHTVNAGGARLRMQITNQVTDNAYFDDATLTMSDPYIESTLADGRADFFQAIGTTLWKAVKPRELKSATDPTNDGSWSSATNVGAASLEITGLIAQENSLYIMKEDQPFFLTAGGTPEVLVDDTVAISTSDSGKNSITWHGDLFMPWGTSSLLRYHNGVPSWIDPALYCRNLGAFDGQIQGLAGDDQWLYAIIDNNGSIEVLAGREEVGRGWIWHGSLCTLTLTGCETAFASSVYEKRIYITSTASGEGLNYLKLYANYGDVTNDANRNFPDAGELYTPWLHGGFKGDTKAFTKITLTLEDASSTVYYESHYKELASTAWIDIGDFQTSPTTVKYIPASTAGVNPSSNMIKFKFVNKTASTADTAKLINVDIRAILYVTKRRIIDCVVRGCEAPLTKQEGLRDDITASHIKTVLIEADNATWPVTFYPWGWEGSGDTIYVNFLSADEVIEIDEESRKPESHWYLRLLEVALS